MLRGVWQALNYLFIHATFCVIATGASPGQTKMKAGVRKNDDFYVKMTIFTYVKMTIFTARCDASAVFAVT